MVALGVRTPPVAMIMDYVSSDRNQPQSSFDYMAKYVYQRWTVRNNPRSEYVEAVAAVLPCQK